MDMPTKFWKEYESIDTLQRKIKIKNIVKRFNDLCELKDEKLRKQSISIALQSYFDDIMNFKAVEEKI